MIHGHPYERRTHADHYDISSSLTLPLATAKRSENGERWRITPLPRPVLGAERRETGGAYAEDRALRGERGRRRHYQQTTCSSFTPLFARSLVEGWLAPDALPQKDMMQAYINNDMDKEGFI
ncbi:hypothetical protein G7046_g4078 [Stylonectria norvegica]|nr:hypothetical protein G7046_g4078 [Stylonectria norvegica]